MPIKLLILVKKRSDLSVDEFRDGYENSHARIAVELFGHLWSDYRRNYLIKGHNFLQGSDSGDIGRPSDIGYDAISEILLPDLSSYIEMQRIGAIHRDRIKEDECRWFDRSACWVVSCETVIHDFSQSTERSN